MAVYKPVRTAVVGCGAISGIYFENLTKAFSIIELVACCDTQSALSQAAAEQYHCKALSLDEILQDESIELVVNLTPPAAHYSVIKTLLAHGKHVYTEKVLAVSLAQAAELVQLAAQNSLQLCCAPDTFLGASVQTAKCAIDSGLIGTVTSCFASLQRDAALLAEKFPYTAGKGGGIGIDVGIYYTTALLSLLGPVTQVCGISKTHEPQRKHFFTSKGALGEAYTIEAETLLAGTLQFASGAVGSLHFNSASIRWEQPQLVLYGTQGILFLPDPNLFGGQVRVLAKGQSEPYVLPHTHAYDQNERGLGVADMAWALRTNQKPRANSDMAYHALEVLLGVIESSETQAFYTMQSTMETPRPLPRGYMGKTYAMSEPEAAFYFDS